MADIAPIPRPALDVRDLRLVLAIAQARTTARAASVLHLTQPAVSRALLAVEEKLGVRLFDRSSRGLVATAAGERLLDRATPLLVELGDLEARVRAPAAAPRRIRIVCECHTAYHWLPSAMLGLRSSLSELRIELALEHTQEPVPALTSGDVDVALLTTAPVPRGISERKLFSDEVVFVVADHHPLASRKTLSRADLRAHPLLTSRAPDDEVRWFMQRVFGREKPRARFQLLPLTEAIVDVTRAGLGIAILSEWIAAPHLARGGLVQKRLSSGPLERPWRLAWRPEVADAAERLHAALRATAPRLRLAG